MEKKFQNVNVALQEASRLSQLCIGRYNNVGY